jgi:hypothetical protein
VSKRHDARKTLRDLLRSQLGGKRFGIDHSAQNPGRVFSEVELASSSVEIRSLDPGPSGSAA